MIVLKPCIITCFEKKKTIAFHIRLILARHEDGQNAATSLYYINPVHRPLRNDVSSIPEHPSRPFLDQALCEHSCVLVGRAAKWALRYNMQIGLFQHNTANWHDL